MTEIQFQSPAPGGRGGAGPSAALTSGGAPAGGPPGFPRGFKVEISLDGTVVDSRPPRQPATAPRTISTFPPVQAKFVRISLTANADDAPAWSVQNLRMFAVSRPGETAAKSE